MTYCWADSHQNIAAKGAAFTCRFPGHRDKIACDSQAPGEGDSMLGVTCCEDAGRHDTCIGPNGPAWPHPIDCDCVEVRRVLDEPTRRNTFKAGKHPNQRHLP